MHIDIFKVKYFPSRTKILNIIKRIGRTENETYLLEIVFRPKLNGVNMEQ